MTWLSQQDRDRIGAAIAAAEKRTSGEIVAVVARESSNYLYAPFMWAALFSLLVPWALIYFTWLGVQQIYLIQLVVFLVLLALFLTRPLRYRLVPQSVKHARAHRRAVEQFLAQDLHTTAGRTGVMIFVSIAERYAEVLADTAIDERVPKGTWRKMVKQLTALLSDNRPADAFISAIEEAGAHLAQHFPPGNPDPNELPDHLIVLT